MRIYNKLFVIALVIILFQPSLCIASFTISPINFFLDSDFKIASLNLKNVGSEKKYIQADILKWTRVNNKDVYTETQDLILTPNIFELGPNTSQLIRIAKDAALPNTRDSAYKIQLREIPNIKNTSGKINFTLRFLLPMFIKATTHTPLPEGIKFKRDKGSIQVVNQSNRHLKILGIAKSKKKSSTMDQIVSYIFPNETVALSYANDKNEKLYMSFDDWGEEKGIDIY